MTAFPIGLKIYDNNWLGDSGLNPVEAADFVAGLGVNFVFTQSHYLPMQDSAVVSSARPTGSDGALDIVFRQELKTRNIKYFACMNVGFDPIAALKRPEWLPIDQYGNRGGKIDWYVGISPANQQFINEKTTQLKRAVSALQPDGIHLGFVRWPGFWETWLPGMDRADLREFCFAPDTLRQFTRSADIILPIDDAAASAGLIQKHYRAQFTDWKCGVTHNMIATLKVAAQRIIPDIPFAANTVPFTRQEFGGAIEEVLGQRHETLAEVLDIFEVMAYHQILKRPTDWPGKITRSIQQLSGQTSYCSIQAGPHYIAGPHKSAGRAMQVTATELEQTIDGALSQGVDGLCFFTVSDFLGGPDSARLCDVVRSISC